MTSNHRKMNPILLAIPVFNEEKHVEGVIREAQEHVRDILVVDDGSTDGTARLLRKQQGIVVLTRPENRGYGKSLADAVCFARQRGFQWLITMDCDGQHEPSYLPCFMRAVRRGDADIISGTRYPKGRVIDESVPPDRLNINRRITAILNQRLGLSITDAFCGYKAYRVSALGAIRITVPGYAMPMQFWVQAVAAGLRIRELPVELIYNDPNRHFGGVLDDPSIRLKHYLEVFEVELAGVQSRGLPAQSDCVSCP